MTDKADSDTDLDSAALKLASTDSAPSTPKKSTAAPSNDLDAAALALAKSSDGANQKMHRNIGWEMESDRLADQAGIGEGVTSAVTGIGGSIAGGLHGLYQLGKGWLTGNPNTAADAASAVRNTAGRLTYAPRSVEGQLAARGIAAPFEAMAMPAEWAGGKITDVTGSPLAGTVVGTLGQLATPLALGRGMSAGMRGLAARGPMAAAALEDVKVVPGDVPVPEKLGAVEHEVLQGQPVKLPEAAPAASGVVPGVTSAPEPFNPAFSAGREQAAFADEAPQSKPGLELPQEEQQRRVRVLRSVGFSDPTTIRQSAVTGDPLAAGTDAQISRLDTDAGRHLKGVIQNERATLDNYASDTVRQTGGRTDSVPGGNQTDAVARGRTVPKALGALDDKLEAQNRALYQAADETAEGRALPKMDNLAGILSDESEFHNFDGGERLLTGLKKKMQGLGLMDGDGNIVPGTVRNSEALRQFINSGDGAYPLRAKIRDAIDQDVFSQSGEDIYSQARALYKLRKDTLENPKGINAIMANDGPNGINRKTPYEDVMGRLESMDPDQLSHIMGVLREMHGDLEPVARDAINNIQAHFASRAQQTGNSLAGDQWNARGHNTFLRNNSETLNTVFQDKPELLHRLYTANEAGKILSHNAAYPGAAAQAANLAKAGVLPGLIHKGSMVGGEAIGSMLGAPGIGTILGENLGARAASGASESAALSAARKRTTLRQTLEPSE